MKRRCRYLKNSDGTVTIAALLILAVLTIIGISAITTSNVEVQIATNDKVHKMAFYAADGGAELGTELLELNIACASGFATDNLVINNITVVDKDFWMQSEEPKDAFDQVIDHPSDTEHDIQIDAAAGPHTNLSIYGATAFGVGGAIEMAAGYEGKGKGAAGGGVSLLYQIFSQHLGLADSESVVAIQWRHNIGSEGTCMY
jgi:hypothetical protein